MQYFLGIAMEILFKELWRQVAVMLADFAFTHYFVLITATILRNLKYWIIIQEIELHHATDVKTLICTVPQSLGQSIFTL